MWQRGIDGHSFFGSYIFYCCLQAKLSCYIIDTVKFCITIGCLLLTLLQLLAQLNFLTYAAAAYTQCWHSW